MIIGLTGGIGSGKSQVADYFRELNIEVIDSDQIARELVRPNQPALKAIVAHFGQDVLNSDGTLNRQKLRSLIFESSSERVWLEQLLHPLIKSEILQLKNNIPKNQYCVVEIPLLIESNFDREVDRVLVVDCDRETRIKRLRERDSQSNSHTRDSLSEEAIEAWFSAQVSSEVRLSKADDVIENIGTLEVLREKVRALHSYYLSLLAR